MMLRLRIPFAMAALALAAAATIPPAHAASQRRAHHTSQAQGDQGNAAIERLNEESLQRARQGQNAPSGGADTTSNLNRMSDQDAQRGQNMNQAPMPFR